MTTTIKIGKDTITNNTTTCKITKNQETIKNYCILDIQENNIIIKQGITISTIPIPEDLQTITKQLQKTQQQNNKKQKTSKTTIKGKTKNNKINKNTTTKQKQ